MLTYCSAVGCVAASDSVNGDAALFIDWKEGMKALLAKDAGVVEAQMPVEVRYLIHFFLCQGEVKDRKVFDQAFATAGFWDDRSAALHSPAQYDLRGRLAVPISDRADAGLAEHRLRIGGHLQ